MELPKTPVVLVQWVDVTRFFDAWTCRWDPTRKRWEGGDQKPCKIGIASNNNTIPKPEVNPTIQIWILKCKITHISYKSFNGWFFLVTFKCSLHISIITSILFALFYSSNALGKQMNVSRVQGSSTASKIESKVMLFLFLLFSIEPTIVLLFYNVMSEIH